jgi:hypothetical protein
MGRDFGEAVGITNGLSERDRVLVTAPEALQDGGRFRSRHRRRAHA